MSKILVADDEMIERKVLVKRLHAHCGENCDILEAENGRQVLEFWEREKPDVLILDIEMPGITGLAAAEMIRKKDRRLPIIFLTAFDEFDYARKAITVHALDYILKPYDQRELFSVVDEALDMAEFGRGTPDPAKAAEESRKAARKQCVSGRRHVGYLWQAFSMGFVPGYLEGDAAREAWREKSPEVCLLYLPEDRLLYAVRGDVVPEALEGLGPFALADTDLTHTFMQTNRAGVGPYFCERPR